MESYQFKQLDSLPVIREDDPRIYYAIKKRYVYPNKEIDPIKEGPYDMIINPIEIPKNQMPIIKNVLYKLKASTLKSIDLKELKQFVQQEFSKNNIDLDFNLYLTHDQIPDRNIFYEPVQLSKDNILIKAQINNIDTYLLKQNLIPLLVSLILILLSAGSLYFMAITIRRQLKLDDLKNDFINNMTHELRTPISILKSSNEALLNFKGINDPAKAERYLRINDDILNKLDHNVDRILDIAQFNDEKLRIDRVKIIPDDLMMPILNRFMINENVRIKYVNQLKDGELYTDPYIIDTILSNLFDNSIKYARGEGVEILLRISSLENGFQLYIEDNGKGIDSIYLPYIFDKFFRVPEGNLHNVKGYGLGLNFVKKLVESLNGDVEVKSELNVGTTFIIKILNV
ncbi:sensor histidine kinase [Chryseobacterium sp. Tr-659]|uniref:sensor histidine kinase n=1 Tax=Chryseobacterium sp. Tr-659 TaxID=2608340 RepID=UPI001421CC8C|nr:HAMP domain-containing sensor histidine kinase [Chryseobacterium sp. Tr-659]